MGGYNFNLLGDDEEQKRLADQQSVLQELLGGADDHAPTVDQTPAPLQASTTDPKVADFRARLDQAKAARASSMGSTDDSSVLDDLVAQHEHRSHTAGDIDTALAMLLDLGANKGRGLGQIVGAYASNRDEESKQDEHFKEQVAFAKAKRKDVDPVAELMRQKQLEIGIEGLGARSAHEAGVEGRAEHNWAQNESPDAPKQTTAVKVAELKAAAGVKGRENQRAEMLPTIENTEGGITGARTTAGTQSKNDTPPDITPAEREHLDLEKTRLADQEENTRIQREINERQKKADNVTKYNKELGGAMNTLDAEKTLEELIGTTGDIPGMGPVKTSRFFPDALLTDKEIKTQQAFAHFRNPEFRKESGAAVTPSEAPRLEAEFGRMESTNPEVVRNAVKAIGETMRNQIRSGSIGREELAREILGSRHLDDVLGPAVTPAPADAPSSARDALPHTKQPVRVYDEKGKLLDEDSVTPEELLQLQNVAKTKRYRVEVGN